MTLVRSTTSDVEMNAVHGDGGQKLGHHQTDSKMHGVLCRNEATATQRYFWVQFSTVRAPAKTTINSDTEEVKRVTATQGITACNSAPCGLLLKTLYTE